MSNIDLKQQQLNEHVHINYTLVFEPETSLSVNRPMVPSATLPCLFLDKMRGRVPYGRPN